MKLGVIQGRLSPPTEGFQETPAEWEKEFSLIEKLGLNHVEWVITQNNFDQNPILSRNLKGLDISSFCADFLISKDFFKDKLVADRLEKICAAVEQNSFSTVTLPLLEESSVANKEIRRQAVSFLRRIVRHYPNIDFLVEAELEENSLVDLLESVPELNIVYDTGNMTTVGVDHHDYLTRFKERIRQVHLKDRIMVNRRSETVSPGSGETPFREIFSTLRYFGDNFFNDLTFTLQTAREKTGDELATIARHADFFRSI